MSKVGVVIITKNEEDNIRECLESAAWADEIFVCDAHSTDRTREIAREFTPHVLQHEYLSDAAQRNWVIPQVACEWVFVLDADERVTPELADVIRKTIDGGGLFDAYRVARKTWFLGKLIRHCGWNKDYPLRLFRRDKGRYEDRRVHGNVIIDGTIGRIHAPLEHHTDHTLAEYYEKSDRYASLAAADMFEAGKTARWWHLLCKPMLKFLDLYLLKLGVLDGLHGLVLCRLAAGSTFLRYAKLWEMNRRRSVGELPRESR
jgi:glycosyltransferase involved in cell wall biosynthesis